MDTVTDTVMAVRLAGNLNAQVNQSTVAHWQTVTLIGVLARFAAITCSVSTFAQSTIPAQPQAVPQTTPSREESFAATATLGTPTFRVVPTFELTERYTDNISLASSTFAKSGWITDVAGGGQLEYRGARANAKIDFRINRLLHEDTTNLDSTQRELTSYANIDVIEKWFFLDARATISQQNRSAFGVATSPDVASTNANKIETTTYQLAPYIRGQFGGIAAYQLRVNGSEARTSEGAFPNTTTVEWNGFIKSVASGRLGWSIDGNALSVDTSATNKRQDSRLRGTGYVKLDTQLHVLLIVGTEVSNLDDVRKRTNQIQGLGLEWSPSSRTRFAAVTQKRFFGDSHSLEFSHRTPRSAWRFSSSKEIAVSANEIATASLSSAGSALMDLLAASVTDPVGRDAAIQARLEQTGIPNASGFRDGVLNSRPFLSRRDEGSIALLGKRSTISFSMNRREQRALDGNNSTSGPGAPVEEIRQVSVNLAWAYRLSPLSTLRLVATRLRTDGLRTDNLTTIQKLQSIFYVAQLGPHTSASLGLRRVRFDSTTATGYQETAVVSSLSVRF